MQNERSAGVDRSTGVDRAVAHAGRIVMVARVPRRTDASRASIGLVGELDRPTPDQSDRAQASTNVKGQKFRISSSPEGGDLLL